MSEPADRSTAATSAEPAAKGALDAGADQASTAKLLIELAPLIAFFATYAFFGIKAATGVLMATTVASMLASWRLLGHITPMLVATTALVVFFGGLTFLLDDPRFIKMKPTVVNLLFAGVLGVGLATGRNFLAVVLGQAFKLDAEGWRILTWRWIGFFLAMAVLNEVVWRTMSETAWVNFKVFAILPLTILFFMSQLGLIQRHTDKSAN